jgi:hypothetical protein
MIELVPPEDLAAIALAASRAPFPVVEALAALSAANARAFAATFLLPPGTCRPATAEAITAAQALAARNPARALQLLERLEYSCFSEVGSEAGSGVDSEEGVDHRSGTERALAAELRAVVTFELELEQAEASATAAAQPGRPAPPG